MSLFSLIAIRTLQNNSVGVRKLITNQWYKLSTAYHITDAEDGMEITVDESKCNNIYNQYTKRFGRYCPDITISAIVGENGSGKSSLLEYAFRLINNLSAATFGERYSTSAFQKLTFIEGMHGELIYKKDDCYYLLTVKNWNVSVVRLNKVADNRYKDNEVTPVFDNELPVHEVYDKGKGLPAWRDKDHLKDFFYSIVSNYSIYAYNALDFASEGNWLSGLFNKNDSYQTPIVLTPYRTDGNFDINNENALGRERLISLLIKEHNSFKQLNGHLVVTGFNISLSKKVYDAAKLRGRKGNASYYPKMNSKGFDKYLDKIPELWANEFGISLEDEWKVNPYYDECARYLTYKTLKNAIQYRGVKKAYGAFAKEHEGAQSKIDNKKLEGLVKAMASDTSHITRKIRQTLSFLSYSQYNVPRGSTEYITLQEAMEGCRQAKNTELNYLENIPNGRLIRNPLITDSIYLVPPAIFDVEICLQDKFILGSKILFETLSSGERQLAYGISSLLYHIDNLNTITGGKDDTRVAYSNVWMVLEEIELYYHPELQQHYISYLLDGIAQMNLCHIEGLHITIVTHSPFVLSDIPTSNVLALRKCNNDDVGNLHTFGANIHDMLNSSFFMSRGSAGAYAQWFASRLVRLMRLHKALRGTAHRPCTVTQDEIHKQIMLFDEPIVRSALLQEFHEVFGNNDKSERIVELEKQLRELKAL